MVGGYTDLRLGRRGHFDKCKYWVRNDEYKDLSEYKLENPSGTFYAERVNARTLQKMAVNNSFLFDETLETIKTLSYVNIESGNLVEFDGELYIAQNVQEIYVCKNEQYMKHSAKETYIQLKR